MNWNQGSFLRKAQRFFSRDSNASASAQEAQAGTSAQSAQRAQGAQGAQSAQAAQAEQGAIKRTGAQSSPYRYAINEGAGPSGEQGAIRRTSPSAIPIGHGPIRRQDDQGGRSGRSGKPLGVPIGKGQSAQGEEGLLRPLSRFAKFNSGGSWSMYKGNDSRGKNSKSDSGKGRGNTSESIGHYPAGSSPSRRGRIPLRYRHEYGGLPHHPLGRIQPDLYLQRTTPLNLPLTGPGPCVGRLHLRMKYDFDRSDLNIHVIELHNLTLHDDGGFSEPYIRVEMTPPVDSKKRETANIKNAGNPYYDEHFKFPVAHDELCYRTLVFQIHDFDRFSRNDIIGEIKIEMSDIEVFSTIEIWAQMSKNRKPREEYQELLLSLSYLPSAQRLTAVVLKGRNLYVNPAKGHVDPLAKVSLTVEGKRAKKRKTLPKKANRNPVWNEAFTFNISAKALLKAVLEVCIYDHSSELMASDVLIGCCVLGIKEEGMEHNHWYEVTDSPRKTVAMWHTLR